MTKYCRWAFSCFQMLRVCRCKHIARYLNSVTLVLLVKEMWHDLNLRIHVCLQQQFLFTYQAVQHSLQGLQARPQGPQARPWGPQARPQGPHTRSSTQALSILRYFEYLVFMNFMYCDMLKVFNGNQKNGHQLVTSKKI